MSDFVLENAESGDVNLIYKNIPLHSKKNPQQEAMQEFNKLKPDADTIIVLTGLGLGYMLKRLVVSSGCKIIVFEPDLNILKFTLQAVDFSDELAGGRVFIVNTPDEAVKMLEGIYQYQNKLISLNLPSAKLFYAEEIKNLRLELSKINAVLQSNYTTLFKLSYKWFICGLRKFKANKIDYSTHILENKFCNKTALIVSAGPSLDKNIEIIKNNREKFIIFCVNVAYKKLVAGGITPDFTVYIDAGNLVFTISDYDHAKTNIINHISSNFKVFEEIKPNKFFTFYCKNDLLSRWIAKVAGFSLEEYKTKGSVAHLAALSAYNMGCNPIILTGQDLAYTDGKIYSSGSVWGDLCSVDEKINVTETEYQGNKRLEKKINALKETDLIKVKGQNGEILLTSPDYAGFIKHFEEFAEEKKGHIKLINASTGGAEIKGFENKTLEEISSGLSPLELNINQTINNIVATDKDFVLEHQDRIRAELENFRNDVEKLIPVCENGIKYSRMLFHELQKRPVNTVKSSKTANSILNTFKELDDGLFQKWDFSLAIAFKELSEFNRLMSDGASQSDIVMFNNLLKVSKELFEKTHIRLKKLKDMVFPYIF